MVYPPFNARLKSIDLAIYANRGRWFHIPKSKALCPPHTGCYGWRDIIFIPDITSEACPSVLAIDIKKSYRVRVLHTQLQLRHRASPLWLPLKHSLIPPFGMTDYLKNRCIAHPITERTYPYKSPLSYKYNSGLQVIAGHIMPPPCTLALLDLLFGYAQSNTLPTGQSM